MPAGIPGRADVEAGASRQRKGAEDPYREDEKSFKDLFKEDTRGSTFEQLWVMKSGQFRLFFETSEYYPFAVANFSSTYRTWLVDRVPFVLIVISKD